jgi:hypothetical protein
MGKAAAAECWRFAGNAPASEYGPGRPIISLPDLEMRTEREIRRAHDALVPLFTGEVPADLDEAAVTIKLENTSILQNNL